MPEPVPPTPCRRPELLVGPLGDHRFAVSDPRSGQYFQMGEEEAFLLSRLDGRHTPQKIREAFAHRFGSPLRAEDLQDFLQLAEAQGFLQKEVPGDQPPFDEVPLYASVFAQSHELYRRAEQVIAGATTHDRRDFGPFPIFVSRADGPYKWDVAGRRLLDFWMGHGALLCGHNFPPVVRAVQQQAALGTHYGACHELEVRWAEQICRLIPSADRVRFTASGTEATQLALRIARAYTGRPLIVKFRGHFHGWHDEAMAHFYDSTTAGINPGTSLHVAVAETDSLDVTLDLLARPDVAGVILEPAGGGSGALPWSRELLQTLRVATRDHGSLLIFDEVISGFRHGPGGVQQTVGVRPDLTTLAKILCGGLPGGAVVGRTDIMAVFGGGTRLGQRFVRVPHTGTYNGNPLSAAAGIAMLEAIADGQAQDQARTNAARLAQQVNEAAASERVDVYLYTNNSSVYHVLVGAHATGVPLGPSPAVTALHYSHPERYARLRRTLLLEGLDTHPLHGWVSAVHAGEALDEAVAAFARAFHRLRHEDDFRY